ncbi:hypothetical protein QOZ80_4BG0336240 [Eleusine coracana subsp. coracana]|nr:hypothetical protein QOZ80_4BG0336240 [Eleusine coracana subsp. coracana]
MLLFLFLQFLLLTCFSPSSIQSMESSTPKCFNISIPYPFGIPGKSSSLSKGFEITCNPSGGGPVLPIGNSVFGIFDISLLDGSMSILASPISWQCKANSSFNLQGTIFTFSDTRNKFTALGCDVVAMLLNDSSGYSGGCASFCSTKDNIINGSCSGVACCQAPVPKGLKKMEVEFIISNKDNSTPPCGEAFIVEQNSYVFSSLDLNNTNSIIPQYRPVVLEWSIDGGSCEEAKLSMSYACWDNTYCYNSSNGIGYRCNCSHGFEGNPYLQGPDGCQDMDECSIGNSCTHKCVNTKGSFYCMCPAGMRGDGLKEGSGCNGVGMLVIATVAGLALVVVLLVLGFWTHWLVKKRKHAKIRQRDIKSSNILVDKNFIAKVSDFGASRSMPHNKTHVTTLVQGTLGYLDPEYFQTSQLTEKSDVYSFGVVLIELLTRKKPILDYMAEEVRSLALQFSMLFYQNQLLEIVDPEVAEEAGMRHVETVAKLAIRCLRLKGEERPRMIEVAIELEALRRLMRQHLILKSNPLLQESSFHGEMVISTPLNLHVDGDNITEDETMEIILLPPRNL